MLSKPLKRLSISFLFVLLQTAVLTAQTVTAFDSYDAGDLIWSDEFEGTGVPDISKWERQEYNRRNNDNGPDGWWSREDSYLDGNGNLVIRLREIPDKNGDGDSCDYSVGALRSKGKFEQRYGKFEIRCKLPTQPGWWVAFWMMQGNVGSVGNEGVDGTEVDIMEAFGWTNRINQAIHWDGYGTEHKSIGQSVYPEGVREGFHSYSLEWYPEMYIFYIDGVETWRTTGGGVCNQPGYIKITGEMSTESWAINEWWSEHPSKATYPDSFIVDYVRVYEIGEYESPAAVLLKEQSGDIELYPNPADERLIVSWDSNQYPEDADIRILSSTGKEIGSYQQVSCNSHIPVANLSQGVYFLAIRREEDTGFLKFIKN